MSDKDDILNTAYKACREAEAKLEDEVLMVECYPEELPLNIRPVTHKLVTRDRDVSIKVTIDIKKV